MTATGLEPRATKFLNEQSNIWQKLTNLLTCVLSSYLYGAFEFIILSCHVGVPDWIDTLSLSECQGSPCLKQAPNLKVKWLQLDPNLEPLSFETSTQPFGETCQMNELCSEYLSVQWISLYVLFISRTRFRVNWHSIVAWISRNSFLEEGAKSEV